MNAIMGLACSNRGLDDGQRALVRKIHQAGQALLGIINDILDFSKIESGRLELEQVPFSLEEVLDHVAAIMSTCVGNKHLELVVSSAPEQAAHLVGDALRLEQVLLNLTGNAIKFTERGEVEVRSSWKPSKTAWPPCCFGCVIPGSAFRPSSRPTSSMPSPRPTPLPAAVLGNRARSDHQSPSGEPDGGDIGVTSELGKGRVLVPRPAGAGRAA